MGQIAGVSPAVMGLTVGAVGVGLPNLLASVLVAKQGLGTMAVSNAFGSNVFNALVSLGLPWFLRTCIVAPIYQGGGGGGGGVSVNGTSGSVDPLGLPFMVRVEIGGAGERERDQSLRSTSSRL